MASKVTTASARAAVAGASASGSSGSEERKPRNLEHLGPDEGLARVERSARGVRVDAVLVDEAR